MKIDLEKLICSLLKQADKTGYIRMSNFINKALKDQSIEYKDGKLTQIENEPKFKVGQTIIYKGTENIAPTKMTISDIVKGQYWDDNCCIVPISDQDNWELEKSTLSSIFKGEWYICIKPINYFTVGKIYYAIKDWVLSGDLGDTFDVRWTSDCFRHATKEDIEKQTTRLNPSTIEMLEKPSTIKFDEPDFERMEAEYCTTLDTPNGVLDAIVQSKMCSAYRKGLEDMYKRLKGD